MIDEFFACKSFFDCTKERYIVCVSGGADSIALFYCTLQLVGKDHFVVAHVNHGWRAESNREKTYINTLCKKYGVKCYCKNLQMVKQTETEARRKRWAYFKDVYHMERQHLIEQKEEHKQIIFVLGHNANDQAETVAMNILRGCGLTGLAGMKSKTKQIVRPFLSWKKEDIYKLVNKHNWTYFEDETNAMPITLRNQLRSNYFLKINEQIGVDVIDKLLQLSLIATDTDEYIEQQAKTFFKRYSRYDYDEEKIIGIHFPYKLFSEQAMVIQQKLIFQMIKQLSKNWTNIDQALIFSLTKERPEQKAHWRKDLPNFLQFIIQKEDISIIISPIHIFKNNETDKFPIKKIKLYSWNCDWIENTVFVTSISNYETIISENIKMLEFIEKTGLIQYNDLLKLDYIHHIFDEVDNVEITNKPISIRTRRAKDYILYQNGKKRKAKQDMNERHIPIAWRDFLLFFAKEQYLVWIDQTN